MTCVTELPTTTIEATQDGDIVNMHVFHHNGAKYAPITDSVLTPSDITGLQERADMILKLGDEWSFHWRRSGCNADAPTFFQCVGEAKDFEANGVMVHPVAFTVGEVQEKTMWGTFTRKNVRLDVEIEKKNYRIVMNYGPGECFSSQKASAKKPSPVK
jgi:hypothetical protein